VQSLDLSDRCLALIKQENSFVALWKRGAPEDSAWLVRINFGERRR